MKFFKTKASVRAERFEINTENFKRETGQKQPFEVLNQGKISRFAICPSCHNPIQLIGLFEYKKVTPHGRHTGKNIKDLPDWDYTKYKYCPYAKHSDYVGPNDDDLLPDVTDKERDLYNLLKEQFDRVVYLVQKELNVRCSNAFWEKALNQFLINHTYLYPWLSEVNLPYIFAYRGMQQQNMIGQKVLINSHLYQALSKHPNVSLVEDNNKKYATINRKKSFLSLQFRLHNHKQIALEGKELKETMMFSVDDLLTGKELFSTKIEFSETFFSNLIRNNNIANRQQELLDIANKIMTGI